MNIYLSLSAEELEWLEDRWAEEIGQRDEARADMAMKRIAQLRKVRHDPLGYVLEAAA